MRQWMPWKSALALAVYLFVLVGLGGIVSAFIFRGGFLLRAFALPSSRKTASSFTAASTVAWARCMGNCHLPVAFVLALSTSELTGPLLSPCAR